MRPLLQYFLRLRPMETSILGHVAGILPTAEQPVFRSQVKAANFQRNYRTVLFTYGKPPAAMAPFADALFAKLAVVTAKGRASGATVVVTVSLSRGILHSLDFSVESWSHSEEFEIGGEIVAPDQSFSTLLV